MFSSKDERSTSEAEVSSTVGQHGTGKPSRHLSTQVRRDTRSGVDLHWIVTGQARGIYPELLDEGTYLTSQDFLQLPPHTSRYNAAAGFVYL